jgi:hypothetical protein
MICPGIGYRLQRYGAFCTNHDPCALARNHDKAATDPASIAIEYYAPTVSRESELDVIQGCVATRDAPGVTALCWIFNIIILLIPQTSTTWYRFA